MKVRGGEFSIGTMGNFQPELTYARIGANLGPKLGPFRPQSGVLGRQRQQTQQDFW
jgi:hypothetical protein